MTHWPLCLTEVALYALFSGLVIWMGLDARGRRRQPREHQDPAEPDEDASDHDVGPFSP